MNVKEVIRFRCFIDITIMSLAKLYRQSWLSLDLGPWNLLLLCSQLAGQSRRQNSLCCVYSNLLKKHIFAQHIQHQHVSTVMQTIVWDDPGIATSFKFAHTAHQTQKQTALLTTSSSPLTDILFSCLLHDAGRRFAAILFLWTKVKVPATTGGGKLILLMLFLHTTVTDDTSFLSVSLFCHWYFQS